MKVLKFLSPLREGRIYEGTIRKYEIKNGTIRIFVELEDEPNNLYMNSQQMSMRTGSSFYLFCKSMGVLDNNHDLDYLIDLPVRLQFKRGNDKNMYISDMCVQEEEEDEENEDEE